MVHEPSLKALEGYSEHICEIFGSVTEFPFVLGPVTKDVVIKCERIQHHFNYLKKLNLLSLCDSFPCFLLSFTLCI